MIKLVAFDRLCSFIDFVSSRKKIDFNLKGIGNNLDIYVNLD